MSSTYSTALRLELQADGENSGTWGQKTNTNLGTLLEQAIAGWTQVNPTGSMSLSASNGVSDQSRNAMIQLGSSGAPSGAYTITVPAVNKAYLIDNQSGQTATFTTGSGGTVSVATGARTLIYCDGTNLASQLNGVTGPFTVAGALSSTGNGSIGGTLGVTGNTTLSGTLGVTGKVTASAAVNWAAPVTVASATSTDVFGAASNYVLISGTTTITGLGTIVSGAWRAVEFQGALTLTNGASLILPTGANITTAAGDTALFVGDGTAARCVLYQRASGAPLINNVGIANSWTAAATFGAPALFNKQASTPFIAASVSAGSLALDFSLGNNFDVSPAGATFTLAVPSNLLPGQSGLIRFNGSGTMTYATGWYSSGGARPALSGAVDFMAYTVYASNFIVFSMLSSVA